MSKQAKQPFTAMTGLPPRDDAELEGLMAAAGRLPRATLEEIITNVFRASLAYERTGNTEFLTCLAEDALVTIRIRRDPESNKAFEDAPDKPGSPEDTVDLEEVLRARGL
jgi:hypothetical protein